VITFRSLRLARGTRVLLEGASLMLPPRARAGIVGANGSGKSSLFAALRGELLPDRGDIEMPAGWSIAHVAQETPAVERPAIDYVIDGDPELRMAEEAMTRADAAGSGEEIALAHERFGALDGYSARARAGTLLSGLGFSAEEHERAVREFSGGWRMRLNLAQALMRRSDLLLLDEPTNHLDIDAIVWLEQWLANYPGTLLTISHDREFLDAVASSIVSFENTSLVLHSGDFSSYERARAERFARDQSLAARQGREVARLQSFIDRFRAQATKARQAQSRMKALARMELIAPAHVADAIQFEFRQAGAAPDPAITLEAVTAGYGEAPVLRGVDLTIGAGSRIGLIGANGAGKTTLIKLLAGLLEPLAGERREGRNLAIGYFAQHQLEQLRPDDAPLEHLQRAAPTAREQELRDHLGQFGFGGDAAFQKVGTMSGGEQSRLVLATLIWLRPNLLLLDEPTNHLDMDTREALTMALQGFEGAVVLVSHDRHLLRTTAEDLIVVGHGVARLFDGDLDDYRAEVVANRSASSEPAGLVRRAERRAEAEQRTRSQRGRRSLVERLTRIEARLADLARERIQVDERLADSALYEPASKTALQSALERSNALQEAIEKAETEWFECQQALESID
jgi:ATP-binding cassette subfamily F protein 3